MKENTRIFRIVSGEIPTRLEFSQPFDRIRQVLGLYAGVELSGREILVAPPSAMSQSAHES